MSTPSPPRSTHSRFRRFSCWPVALALLLAGEIGAQELHWDIFGLASGDNFGQSVAGIGDVNLDGIPDFAIGSPGDDTMADRGGAVTVYSGADSSVLYQVFGTEYHNGLGHRLAAAGDLNADGRPDFLVSSEHDNPNQFPSGFVQARSGPDGSLLQQWDGWTDWDHFGHAIAGAGDVNGDGFDDVIIGAPQNSWHGVGSGSAFVFSGSDGSQLHMFHGGSPWELLGQSVTGAGDVNGDGFADFGIGARLYDAGQRTDAGGAWVHSGVDGTVLVSYTGRKKKDHFGVSMAGLGDLNQDGVPDLVVGGMNDHTNLERPGFIRALSNADGEVLYTINYDQIGEGFGAVVASAGDVDGDGVQDIMVGAPWGGTYNGSGLGSGALRIYSGFTGYRLVYLEGPSAGVALGTALGGLGDITGDHLDDWIVGVPNSGTTGRAQLYRSPTEPWLRAENFVSGQVTTLIAENCVPGAPVTFYYSLSGLGQTVLPGTVLDLAPPVTEAGNASADVSGVAQFSSPLPPGTSGLKVYLQAYQKPPQANWQGSTVVHAEIQ